MAGDSSTGQRPLYVLTSVGEDNKTVEVFMVTYNASKAIRAISESEGKLQFTETTVTK